MKAKKVCFLLLAIFVLAVVSAMAQGAQQAPAPVTSVPVSETIVAYSVKRSTETTTRTDNSTSMTKVEEVGQTKKAAELELKLAKEETKRQKAWAKAAAEQAKRDRQAAEYAAYLAATGGGGNRAGGYIISYGTGATRAGGYIR